MRRHGANRLFQPVRVRLRFIITQIIWFSSRSLFLIFENTVRLRFGKNSIKPVWVRFDSLPNSSLHNCCIEIFTLRKKLMHLKRNWYFGMFVSRKIVSICFYVRKILWKVPLLTRKDLFSTMNRHLEEQAISFGQCFAESSNP